MTPVLLVARRDLQAYLRGLSGYVIIAAMLFLLGLMFQAYALSGTARYSHEVLQDFFEFSGGFAMVASVLLTMRSFAEERSTGTEILLQTSPVHPGQVVLGKYLAVMTITTLMWVLSLYMPALIFLHGKVSVAHIAVGYVGLLCLGSAATAIGLLGSSLTSNQFIAGLVSGILLVTLLMGWKLSELAGPTFSGVLSYMALWDKHFPHFMQGKLHLRDLVFYLSITGFGLLATTLVVEGRRWR